MSKTTPTTKALKPIDEVRNSLTKMEPQFKMALPPHIPVEKFLRVANTAVGSNPDLVKKDRASLFAACMKAAQDGLLPDGKEAALVPFGDQVTYMPMIAGVLKKIRNSGELAMITSQVVHKNDEFSYWVDHEGEHITHRPNLFSDRGAQIGVYALAKTKDGAIYIEVMTMEQLKSVQSASRGGGSNSSPWNGPFKTEMHRKSVLRRLSKRLPMSTDLEGTLTADDELFMPEKKDQPAETVQREESPAPAAAAPKKRNSRISNLVDQAPSAEPQEAIEVEAREVSNDPEPPHTEMSDDEIPI